MKLFARLFGWLTSSIGLLLLVTVISIGVNFGQLLHKPFSDRLGTWLASVGVETLYEAMKKTNRKTKTQLADSNTKAKKATADLKAERSKAKKLRSDNKRLNTAVEVERAKNQKLASDLKIEQSKSTRLETDRRAVKAKVNAKGRRVVARSKAMAKRNVVSMGLEAVPVIGIGAMVGVTLADVNDICASIEDMNAIYEIVGITPDTSDAQKLCLNYRQQIRSFDDQFVGPAWDNLNVMAASIKSYWEAEFSAM